MGIFYYRRQKSHQSISRSHRSNQKVISLSLSLVGTLRSNVILRPPSTRSDGVKTHQEPFDEAQGERLNA